MKDRGVIDAFWLKNIMLVFMALDHVYAYLLPHELLPAHYLARIVAPVFTFLAAESMFHTSNRRRYITRLFISGAIMTAVNIVLSLLTGIEIANNIFLPLGIGASLIYCLDKVRCGAKLPLWFSICAVLAYASFFCEGGYLIPMMAVIFYFFRNDRVLMYCLYVAFTGFPFVLEYLNSGYLQAQFFMIFGVIPITLYNGKRGPDSAFAKYFFYLFYPLHIWIIVLVKYLFFTS